MSDWRGESIIRSVPRNPWRGQGNKPGHYLPAEQRADPRRPKCEVPGCINRLGRENSAGVCRWHLHAEGLCRCAKCLHARGEA